MADGRELERLIGESDRVLARDGGSNEPEARGRIAEAMTAKADALSDLGRNEESLAVLAELVRSFEASDAPPARVAVARALYNRAGLLRDVGRADEALAAWSQVAERFAADPPSDLEFIALEALYNRGHNLLALGRADEAILTLDEVIERYGHESSVYARMTIADALMLKARSLERVAPSQVPGALDEVVARFDGSPEAELRERLAQALAQKVWFLMREGRSDPAIAVSEELFARFERESDPGLTAEVGDLLLRAASSLLFYTRAERLRLWAKLGDRGRLDQGLSIIDRLIARVRPAADPQLRQLLVRAQLQRAESLAQLGRLGDAVADYEQFFDMGEPSLEVLDELATETEMSNARLKQEQLASTLALTSGGARGTRSPRRDAHGVDRGHYSVWRRQVPAGEAHRLNGTPRARPTNGRRRLRLSYWDVTP